MKVLFMTNIPAPYRVNFFNQLAKKCDLTVLFEQKNNSIRNTEWYKDNTYNFKYYFLPNFYLKELIQILKKDYDIIIMGNYASIVSAIARFYFKFKKKKYIISADGGFVEDKVIFTKWIKTYFMSSADYWISSGEETTKYLTNYGAKKENIYPIHFTSLYKEEILKNPIKYNEKSKLRKKLGYNYSKIFLSVGRIVYDKGYDILLKTIKENKFENIAFIIVGIGKEIDNYKQYVIDNQIKNVFFIGFKDKKETLELYKMADVFFFLTRHDVWGLVINEAMANGLPIISSNKAIASLELISQEHLFDINYQEQFKTLLKKMGQLGDKELYDIGKSNLDKIKDYSIEQMVEDHIVIFKDILKREGIK